MVYSVLLKIVFKGESHFQTEISIELKNLKISAQHVVIVTYK